MAKSAAAATAIPPVSERGENFLLYGSMRNQHTFGRDDLAEEVLKAKSEHVLHSLVDLQEAGYRSHYKPRDPLSGVLPATRHLCSRRYQDYKAKSGLACCVAAIGGLRTLRARAWNEDHLDQFLDDGTKLFQESLDERGGDLRKLILPELNEKMTLDGKDYTVKLVKGVAVWGRLGSADPLVFDLTRGLENFFKETDAGILQIPGFYEVAIWQEGGKYYMFDPWPADPTGRRVGLREGGHAYAAYFLRLDRLADHFLNNLPSEKRRCAYSISEVRVERGKKVAETVGEFKGVSSNRWIVNGRFHGGDARFPEENRNRQAMPSAIAAIAIANVADPANWTADHVDQAILVGDNLYSQTMLKKSSGGAGGGDSDERHESNDREEDGEDSSPASSMSAGEVLDKFNVSEGDFVETEVFDRKYSGKLDSKEPRVANLKDALNEMFKQYSHALVNARGSSIAVWKQNGSFYYFDPYGCDENGFRSDSTRAAACIVRIDGSTDELAEMIQSNLPAGTDDSFNISPVTVSATKMNEELGMPEIKLQSGDTEWVKPGTAAILMGSRGESSAAGKIATKAGVTDLSGRTLALPAAAAFTAAAVAVPPPMMHQDHMHHFIEAGADFYLENLKKTGRTEMTVEDLANQFELGANTFSVELGTPIKAPLKLPDPAMKGEGAEEEEPELEGEIEAEEENKIKEMKDAIAMTMYVPNSLGLLVGDYHTLGVWCNGGGQVVAFDPAPTLRGGLLTLQRMSKGDEIRVQRLADEAAENRGEDDEDADDEEGEEEELEGEQQPLPEIPDVVPPDAAPALHFYASPTEFVDKLVAQGGLSTAQRLAPYKLYPISVTNELTTKDKKPQKKKEGDEDEEGESEEASPAAKLDQDVLGKHYSKVSEDTGALRGRLAQHEYFFLENNRDNQDAAMAVMGIVADNIEPHKTWTPSLVDALVKYGDRLYTLSINRSKHKPKLHPDDIVNEFHFINFNVKLNLEPDVMTGDIKAGDSGEPLNVKRALKQFFSNNSHGVLCAKDYCVAVWKASDGKSVCIWDAHAVSSSGLLSPSGSAGVVVFASEELLANTFLENVESLSRPGHNKFSIASVKVDWSFAPPPPPQRPTGGVLDDSYEHKVLTAYVETGKGRTVLRGSRAPDTHRFKRDTMLQSSCGAIVGACMAHVRRPETWTRHTVDEIIKVSGDLFSSSVCSLGYEFRPGEDCLLPLQVLKRFTLGVNYIRFELDNICSGNLDHSDPSEMSLRCALERYLVFDGAFCIVWSASSAVAAWRLPGPLCYMWEPHACGPTGLRLDGDDGGAACVMTFVSPKLLAHAYLQNIPIAERSGLEFSLYSIAVSVQPVKPTGGVEPPTVRPPPGKRARAIVLPATSKVDVYGNRRLVKEADHGPKVPHAVQPLNKNSAGWVVTADGAMFLSAECSINSKKFSSNSRGYQGLSCCILSIVMGCFEDICRWTSGTLGSILEYGDQLYKDSYLHYKPKETKYLTLHQILRKFYTTGNCVYHATVYCARHGGHLSDDGQLYSQMNEFFREENRGVVVCGDFCAALFRTARGYYMFEPVDRDKLGRILSHKCRGRGRACLSKYPTVQMLADRLLANIEPKKPQLPFKGILEAENTEDEGDAPAVSFEEKPPSISEENQFKFHGVNVKVSKSRPR